MSIYEREDWKPDERRKISNVILFNKYFSTGASNMSHINDYFYFINAFLSCFALESDPSLKDEYDIQELRKIKIVNLGNNC